MGIKQPFLWGFMPVLPVFDYHGNDLGRLAYFFVGYGVRTLLGLDRDLPFSMIIYTLAMYPTAMHNEWKHGERNGLGMILT